MCVNKKSGWFQGEIARSVYRKQMEIEKEERVIVRFNRFTTQERPDFRIHRTDPRVAEEMKGRVRS